MDPHPAFEIVYRKHVPEINAEAVRYRHRRTGADVLSLRTTDDNKVFGISFRTPPGDSTGVAHILEHSVLCGSEKYPLKEPFKELMKGSLNTFLNAFTYPDKTVYPVASRNLKDFYNLVDVYLDAVFFPTLGEPVFMQEGWHYELAEPGGALTYKGVVFNEMKGVYSSADSVAMEAVTQSLLPDSTYGVDSGGDPEVIPALTYEQFEKFHRDHYHPSNALAYFYGDDPEPRRLELLDAYFSRFEPADSVPAVKPQPAFEKPARSTRRYAAAGDEESSEGCFVIHAWKLGDCTDLANALAWGVLNHLLLGSPASPMRRDLLESGLGEEIAGGGFQAEGLHMVFSIGLKGVDEEDIDDVHRLIRTSLESSAREGFEPELIEAAFNTIEFSLRENNTGSWPRGLVVLLRALAPWSHGVDPVEAIAWEKPLAEFKAALAADPRLFQDLITRDILDNTHLSTIAVRPDPLFAREQDHREQQRLLQARARMTPAQLETIQVRAEALRKMQQEPDTPEALARMPRLGLGDLDRLVECVPKESGRIAGVEVLHHPQPTTGIVYIDLVFDLRALPYRLLPLLPIFARCLTELGTDRHDFASLARWIGCKTGGIHEMMYTGTHEKTLQPVTKLLLRGKAMIDKVGDLLEILGEVITATRFDQQAKLLEFVQEDKAGEESRLIPSGSSFVRRRMAAHFSIGESVSELLDGFEQVRFLRSLVHRCRNDWRDVLRDLEHLRKALLNREGMMVNVTCEPAHFPEVSRRLEPFLAALPRFEAAPELWNPFHPPRAEGLRGSSQVNFVGRAFNVREHGYQEHGSSLVACQWLRNSWLWDRVRVQGGAYGVSCGLDQRTGAMSFVSYRDPAVAETIKVFHQSAEALRKNVPSGTELEQNIIGVFGSINPCLLPVAKGYSSLVRHLTGMTDEARQRIRDEVLETHRHHLLSFADVIQHLAASDVVAVLGAGEKIREAAPFAKGGELAYTDLFD